MKRIGIVALAMALIMVCLSVAACGGAAKKVTCTVSIVANGKRIADKVECPVTASGDKEPVVLDALKLVLDFIGAEYEIGTTNLKKVVYEGTEYSEGRDAEGKNHWFWVYTANGEEPENGSAAVNVIHDGDAIEFVYTSIPVDDVPVEQENGDTGD